MIRLDGYTARIFVYSVRTNNEDEAPTAYFRSVGLPVVAMDEHSYFVVVPDSSIPRRLNDAMNNIILEDVLTLEDAGSVSLHDKAWFLGICSDGHFADSGIEIREKAFYELVRNNGWESRKV